MVDEATETGGEKWTSGSRLKWLALVASGAVLYGAAFPPLELAPLAWAAPVAWLLLLRLGHSGD